MIAEIHHYGKRSKTIFEDVVKSLSDLVVDWVFEDVVKSLSDLVVAHVVLVLLWF